ncbi:sulfotransferase family protein [Tropicimonas sp. IMCC6043]|uniref:sulfotransferase family protein n=1 Tax=Tropicimonas sp. IMCC6043 TaxID=2510645 RepID=UPI00101E11E5|nr:sulfotransferase family protein [Tropicimonas sp. IMCC6043]RYH09109.1 sulfotransferase family protein [Tropicimonas sp. IMCC6043]
MTLEVIGAGYGRTGTDSMREALNILGFGPCHHMFEVTNNPVMKSRWRTFMTDGVADWDALFEGYRSCVDWPAVHYWRDLLARYPDARVILTERDAEGWWKSFESTLLKYVQTTEDHESVGYRIMQKAFGNRVGDRDHMIAAYRAHVADVIDKVPEDRLLTHHPGDGWEPLCAFLGVDIPDEPYPFRNTTSAVIETLGLNK